MTEKSSTSFEKFDLLSLKPFCEKLERYLLVEHDYVDGGLVVGLNAGFGSGKTTFVKMWKNDLLSRRISDENVPQAVVLNAWKSDYCGDPLSAILAGLIDAVRASNATTTDKESLKDAAKEAAWFIAGLANQVAEKLTGIDVMEAGESAKNKNDPIPDFINLFRQRSDALMTLKKKLTAVFGGNSPRVLVFIDELDRCRPDYAVNYLETIKHVFDIHGMVFVLAIDYAHLASSTKALFGQGLNFEEYFRKFCHRVINLPEPAQEGFEKLVADYVHKYFEIENKRACGIDLQNRFSAIVELALGLKMRPRQLQEAFRIVGHACSVKNEEHRGKIFWCITSMVIFLSFLKVAQIETYAKIRNKKMLHEDVGIFLTSLVGKDMADWWFKIYLTGLNRKVSDNLVLNLDDILQKAGFLDVSQSMSGQEQSQFQSGWGHSSRDKLENVFQRIETCDSF